MLRDIKTKKPMTYESLLAALAASMTVVCGDMAHRVQRNLFGDIEVFDMNTDTAEPLRFCHLAGCSTLKKQ